MKKNTTTMTNVIALKRYKLWTLQPLHLYTVLTRQYPF